MWFISFNTLMQWVIDIPPILIYPCISEINSTWFLYIINLIYCHVWFSNIFSFFESLLMMLTYSLLFSFSVVSNYTSFIKLGNFHLWHFLSLHNVSSQGLNQENRCRCGMRPQVWKMCRRKIYKMWWLIGYAELRWRVTKTASEAVGVLYWKDQSAQSELEGLSS